MAKVKIKFNPVREVLHGKKVVVVDDSIVRGTTSRALVQLIRQAGAAEVHFRVASPPITGPCYYGIDTPSKQELIGSSNSVDQIREHLGVDSLGYLSLDGMLRAAGGDPSDFCHACFSGDYPTDIPRISSGAQRRAAPRRYPQLIRGAGARAVGVFLRRRPRRRLGGYARHLGRQGAGLAEMANLGLPSPGLHHLRQTLHYLPRARHLPRRSP